MSTTFETGHAKNIANFYHLLILLRNIGPTYNPSLVSIQLPQLEKLYLDAEDAHALTHSAFVTLSEASAVRSVSFKPLGVLLTRAFNAFKVCGAPAPLIDSAIPVIRKFRGKRASAKIKTSAVLSTDVVQPNIDSQPTDVELPAEPVQPVIKQISTAQVSFDMKLENFDKLINILEYCNDYHPNEDELKVGSLKSRFESMNTQNKLVMDAQVVMNTIRFKRNKILYDPHSGLTATTIIIKDYLKSAFGTSSNEYKQVIALHFSRK